MQIEGSCFCGAVSYTVQSDTPYPYRTCYCSRCRKTGGSAHLMAHQDTLEIHGANELGVYVGKSNPQPPNGKVAELHMSFCKKCGTHLLLHSPSWPGKIYPWAYAVDTDLPKPPENFHINVDQAPTWLEVIHGNGHVHFSAMPEESMDDYHDRHGLRES